MILLDTNVLSALMLADPDQVVVEWLDAQPAESLWTTAVTVFEIRTGLELIEPSKRRDRLTSAFEQLVTEDLDGRVLAFDRAAADAAGSAVARARRSGRPVEIRDAEIAGIALARRAMLATRNVKHFGPLGVRLVDPWRA